MGPKNCTKCGKFLTKAGLCTNDKCKLFNMVATFTLAQEERLLRMMTKVVQEALQNELQLLKNQLHEALQQNATLQAENARLQSALYDVEQYTRRKNVVLVGIPETNDENLYEVVKKCGEAVGVTIHEEDIDIVHRVTAKNVTSNKPALIVVKFMRLKLKQKFVSKWRMKKPTSRALGFHEENKIFVNDHLSPACAILLQKARDMQKEYKFEYVWVRDCKIFVRKSKEDEIHLIQKEGDLHSLMEIVSANRSQENFDAAKVDSRRRVSLTNLQKEKKKTKSTKQTCGRACDTSKVDLSGNIEDVKLKDKSSTQGTKPNHLEPQEHLTNLQMGNKTKSHVKKNFAGKPDARKASQSSATLDARSKTSGTSQMETRSSKKNFDQEPLSDEESEAIDCECFIENFKDIKHYKNLYYNAFKPFRTSGGSSKKFFNYLLMDSRKIERMQSPTSSEQWNNFISSIFYIGKGEGNRPKKHFGEVVDRWKWDCKRSDNKKYQHILDIWTKKSNVIILWVFKGKCANEAKTREAAMLDAIGKNNLGNIINGTYYGPADLWKSREKEDLGMYLLWRASREFKPENTEIIHPGNYGKRANK